MSPLASNALPAGLEREVKRLSHSWPFLVTSPHRAIMGVTCSATCHPGYNRRHVAPSWLWAMGIGVARAPGPTWSDTSDRLGARCCSWSSKQASKQFVCAYLGTCVVSTNQLACLSGPCLGSPTCHVRFPACSSFVETAYRDEPAGARGEAGGLPDNAAGQPKCGHTGKK
jgi:hypothetical protein